MTKLFDKRLGRRLSRRLGALVPALVLALGITGLGLGSGCKKAAKKDQTKSAPTTPADSMDVMGASALTKDGKKKTAAGMNITEKTGVTGAPVNRPGGGSMAATPAAPGSGQPRPATGPMKVQLVVGLNAAKLRKTFLWKQLMAVKMVQAAMTGSTYGKIKKALGKDPLVLVDAVRIVLGGTSLNDIKKPQHLVLSLSGRFDAAATLKKLMTIPVKPGESKPVLTKINGKVAIRGKGKKGVGFALLAMNKNTIALCSDSMLHIATKGDLTGGDGAIAAQIKALDVNSLGWIVFGGIQVPLGNASAVPALAALKKIQGGSVVLDNGKTEWKMVNRLDVSTPQAAKSLLQLVSMMKMTLGKGGARPGGAPPGLGAILKHLKVTAKGQILIASLVLPEAGVKKLLSTILSKL